MLKLLNQKLDPVLIQKVHETKDKIAKAFSELGVPVPDEMQEQKEIPKADEKLIHVGMAHLYMGSLKNVRASLEHLHKLSKKGDNRATSLIPVVKNLEMALEVAIGGFASKVDEMPSVKELDELFIQLEKEHQNAALLQIMNIDVPKGKMH